MSIDIEKLYKKAIKVQKLEDSIQNKLEIINRIKKTSHQKFKESQTQIQKLYQHQKKNNRQPNIHKIISPKKKSKEKIVSIETKQLKQKNPTVGDVDKMMFEKKFKNFINHKQQFIEKARKRRQIIIERRKAQIKLEPGEDYYNEQEVLSNTDSQYQYADALDMKFASQQIATGNKHKKGGVELYHAQKFEFNFRVQQYEGLLMLMGEEQLVSKDLLLAYFFEQPFVMMIYSINPYLLADQLAEWTTKIPEYLSFEQFSGFLLCDREPTYFEYSHKNLEQARKLGRGLKCAPIVGKWIGDESVLQLLINIFYEVDFLGGRKIERSILAKKIYKEAEARRLLDYQVVEVVNIGKKIPLNRIIYEIEYEERQQQQWTYQEYANYIQHYTRLATPEKDKIITKMIMVGKYDPTYIYVVSAQVLEFLKKIFQQMQKFAEYFVLKDKFIQTVCKDLKYNSLKKLWVRSESNRFVFRQTVEDTLERIMSQGDKYLDIEEILEFFTNRGRPRLVQHYVYIANLEKQIALIEEQERLKLQKLETGETLESSDEQYSQQLKQRKYERKKQKMEKIHKQNLIQNNKKLNVTIPVPFGFQKKERKISIRERKLKEMLEDKKIKQEEQLRPIKPKQVPKHVHENLYQRFTKDQQRQRKQRLQRFKIQLMNSMHPVSAHLVQPKTITEHCDFSKEQYKFIARPMPWYCQVNLLKRINDKKLQRREQILESVINRQQGYDLPWGVQQMMNRQAERQEKRLQNKTRATSFMGQQCTFIPKISQQIPNFKALHQQLQIDLNIARQQKQAIQILPFSFQNRPRRVKTVHKDRKVIEHKHHSQERHHKPQAEIIIPPTMKYQALVELRRKQKAERQNKIYQQQKAKQIRRMRHQKFAPIVRQVLRKKDHESGNSQQQIQQKIKDFRRNQKKKKAQYQEQMLKIYTKVFNRPLLVETMGQFGQNQIKKISRFSQEKIGAIGQQRSKRHHQKKQEHIKYPEGEKIQLPRYQRDQEREHFQRDQRRQYHKQHHDQQYNQQYDAKRKKLVQQHRPGQYDYQDQMEFQEEDMSNQQQSIESGNRTS